MLSFNNLLKSINSYIYLVLEVVLNLIRCRPTLLLHIPKPSFPILPPHLTADKPKTVEMHKKLGLAIDELLLSILTSFL